MATAVQVESILGGLTDNSGQPLAAGKVYTYYAGSTTPVSLYTASDKSTSATNPLILDGHGKAQVWADGRYKFVIKDQYDVTQYTLDNLLYGFDDTTVLWGGQSTGSANAHTVSVPATVGVYANGQRVSFIAGYTNTGAATLQYNALAAVSIVKGANSVSLEAGDIVAGQLVDCVYEAYSGTGRFRLENYPTASDVQRSRYLYATNVGGINSINASLTPPLDGYEAGLFVRFKAANTNTGAVTLDLNGKGAKTVQFANAALIGGEIQQNVWHDFVYDGNQFQLINPHLVSRNLWGGTTGGTSTAYTIAPAPAITSYAAGQIFSMKVHVANGAAPTLAVNGLAAKVIKRQGSALVGNEIKISELITVQYDGTDFQLLHTATSPIFVNRTSDKVGIGTTAPISPFDIMASAATGASLCLRGRAADDVNTLLFSTNAGVEVARIQTDPNSLSINKLGNSPVVFLTNGAERFRVTGSGQFVVGQSTTIFNQEILAAGTGTGGQLVTCNGGNSGNDGGGAFVARNGTSSVVAIGGRSAIIGGAYDATPLLFFAGSPKVQGISSGAGDRFMKWSTTTNVWSYDTSSERFKSNITDLHYGLNTVMQLRSREFDYKEDARHDIGFIAEEVVKVVPEVVGLDAEGKPEAVMYDRLTSLLCRAIQDLNTKLEALSSRIASLEGA